MKNDPKKVPEIKPLPQKGEETPIPPEFIPEPKKHTTITPPEKEKPAKNNTLNIKS